MKTIICCIVIVLSVLSPQLKAQSCNLKHADTSRKQVTIMQPPNSYVISMTMNRGASYNGTAFFIHPRVLLTAGHNVRKRPQIWSTRVKSLDIRVKTINPTNIAYQFNLPTIQDSNIYANHAFNKEYSIWMDYGLIILPDSTAYTKAGGCFKITAFDSAKLSNETIHIASYPKDKPYLTMWADSTKNHFPFNGYIHYEFATDHGSSGAPLWYMDNGKPTVFAIHTNGKRFDKYRCNTGTVLTQEIINEIISFCKSKGIDITQQQ